MKQSFKQVEEPFITYERKRIENEFNKKESTMREKMNKIKNEMDDANEQYKKDKGRFFVFTFDFG